MQARYVYYPVAEFPIISWRASELDTFVVTATVEEANATFEPLLDAGDKILCAAAPGNPSWVAPDGALTFLVARDKSVVQIIPWSHVGNTNMWAKRELFHPLGDVVDKIVQGLPIGSLDDLAGLAPRA